MRALIQRVSSGNVIVEGETIAEIGKGIIILLGIAPGDGEEQAQYLVDKIANLRIFEDAEGKLNLSLLDIGGEVLSFPNLNLYAVRARGADLHSPTLRCRYSQPHGTALLRCFRKGCFPRKRCIGAHLL
jgi:D-tyrosyl-tRNA(Tyr) deacylase